jgi:hypothetical protein
MPFARTGFRAAALCLLALLYASTVDAQDQPASDLPEPEEGLHVSRSSYLVMVAMNGQQMEMNVTHEVEDIEEGWRVTETAESPMGQATDVEVLNREALTPITRTVTQGPMRIELSYSDSTVDGTIRMQGNEQAVDIALDGPIYSDGAAANLVIAALPLVEDYHAEYQTLDLMQQRRRQMQIDVAGIDSVDVPAGSFQTFRVEISSAEGGEGGTTLWIDQESRLVVRAETSVPQLDGATLTSELQSSSRLDD